MVPGIWPTILMAGSPPLFDVYITPSQATWFGEMMNYTTSVGVVHSGGTAPFTYFWTTDGGATIVDRTKKSIELTSSAGAPATLQCLVTDAAGQSAFVSGGILGVSGGGGA